MSSIGSAVAESTDTFHIHVEDETSPLRTVIVHRPGGEMDRLTPPNHKALLFDDLLSPEKAEEEHNQFVELMSERGVTSLRFMDLFTETLALSEARDYVLSNTVNRKRLGPILAPALEEWARELAPAQTARLCVEGITKGEWAQVSSVSSLVAQTLSDEEFLISPLPNHLFTRDASVWMYGGVAISSMNREARRRESLHYSAVYNYHPGFATTPFETWTDGKSGAIRSAEGGDILVLGNGVVAIGLSERTTPQGAEHIAMHMFTAGKARKVLAFLMPKSREFMHLDTILTQVDDDAFVLYPGAQNLQSVLLEYEDGHVRVGAAKSGVAPAVENALERPLRFIWPEATEAEISREQWNDGFNMLALSPGVVVAYDRTPLANTTMREAGIEVLEIGGSELGRGRGGPRCMSCPIERAPRI